MHVSVIARQASNCMGIIAAKNAVKTAENCIIMMSRLGEIHEIIIPPRKLSAITIVIILW